MMKLNRANLAHFTSINVKLPTIEPKKCGIVHFGVGGFHRAHQEIYTEDAMVEENNLNWGIIGVGILPNDAVMNKALNSQDCLYSLMVKPAQGNPQVRVVNSMVKYIFGYDNHDEVFDAILNDNIKIITLTITEGGYNVNQRTGEFDFNNPLIKYDIENLEKPKTIFGFLARALHLRKDAGKCGLTIQSCDNVQHNGNVARRMFLTFLEIADRDLIPWVEANCTFPNSMVDRITPQTNDADMQLLKDFTGIEDAWPVTCEPFTQWVIEDKFAQGRPKWELVGAQIVNDVTQYEKMKLRLLNSAHQALGYVGYLHGYRYVHEASQDPVIKRFVRYYMKNEAADTVGTVPGINLDEYQDSLLERFSNPNIKDTLSRICEFTSDRLPVFNVPAMIDQIERAGDLKASAYIIASWLVYALGKDEKGNEINVVDNRKEEIQAAAKEAEECPEMFLKFQDLFGALCDSAEFKQVFSNAYFKIRELGARKAIEEFMSKKQI